MPMPSAKGRSGKSESAAILEQYPGLLHAMEHISPNHVRMKE